MSADDPRSPMDNSRRERRRLTHVSRSGRPRMVDVSDKPSTARRAVAEAFVSLEQETLTAIIDGVVGKGDVLTVAEMAGVMGAKRTSELIPLCHPIPLTDLVVEITPERAAGGLRIRATAATVAPTGVEMEAMTAASVAALTVYDMVKGVDRTAFVRDVRLLEKSGGKSGEWRRPASQAGQAGQAGQFGTGEATRLPGKRRSVRRRNPG
jgi:cyclic pyranopterin phosphate synthase